MAAMTHAEHAPEHNRLAAARLRRLQARILMAGYGFTALSVVCLLAMLFGTGSLSGVLYHLDWIVLGFAFLSLFAGTALEAWSRRELRRSRVWIDSTIG